MASTTFRSIPTRSQPRLHSLVQLGYRLAAGWQGPPGRSRVRAARGVAAALAGWILCACVCPVDARALANLDLATPRRALESYQSYLAYDLREQEYRCFSVDFRQRNRLSLANYAEGRDRLLARSPWLKSFAGAKVVAEGAAEDGSHWIDARVLGRTVRVRLVREDFYEIRAAGELLADGYGELGAWFDREPTEGGWRLVARPAAALSTARLASATELRVARQWKIDDFVSPPPPSP